MKTKKLAMQKPKTRGSLKPILLDLLLAVKLVVTHLARLTFFILGFILFLISRIAVMAFKALKASGRYLLLTLGRIWQIREARGFILGVLITASVAIFLFSKVEPKVITVQNNSTEVEAISDGVDTIEAVPAELEIAEVAPEPQPEPQIEIDWSAVDFVNLTYQEKINFITERLKFNGVSDTDIKIFTEIATLESCRDRGDHKGCMNPEKTPPVVVKHCKGGNGWYVVEINSVGGQAQCAAGHVEGRNEQSFGMFQILETTWEGNQCEGNRFDWYSQVDCAVKVKNRSGFSQWSTYKMISQ